MEMSEHENKIKRNQLIGKITNEILTDPITNTVFKLFKLIAIETDKKFHDELDIDYQQYIADPDLNIDYVIELLESNSIDIIRFCVDAMLSKQ